MQESDCMEVPKLSQVRSLFKAALELLDVEAEELDNGCGSTEEDVYSVGSPVPQETIAQGSSNAAQKFVWPHEGVVLLLEQYRKVEYEFYRRKKRHGKLWDEIAEAMRKQSNLNVTGIQCQQKISGLKRTYANIKEHFSSYDASDWPYFSTVEELFGDKERVVSAVTSSSFGTEGHDFYDDGSNNPETYTSDVDQKPFFLWPHEGVLSLLELYKSVEHKFYMGKKRHSLIWDEIAEEIQAKNGIRVTGIQCQQKISGMKRTYWGIKENHPCPNSNTVPWQYYTAADEIFSNRSRIPPAAAHSSTLASVRKQTSSIMSPPHDDNLGTCPIDPNKKSVFTWPHDGVFLLLEQYREVEHEFFLSKKRHTKIWEEIAEAVHTVDSDLKPTGLQCQQKISGLKRTYMTIKENHPCPTADTVTWPYFAAVDEIFGHTVRLKIPGCRTSDLEMPDSDDDNNIRVYTNTIIKRNSFVWSHKGVCLLLEQFKQAQQEFSLGEKRYNKIWDEISAAVQANSDLKPTGLQCQQKINGLKRAYAAIKENRLCSSTDQVSWPYFSVMDEIFGNKANMAITPTIACSTGPEMLQKDAAIHSSSSDDGNNPGNCSSYVNRRNMFVWPNEGVFLLLEQYREAEHEFSFGNKLHIKIWDQIAAAIRMLTNSKVTGVQCLRKLWSLKRIYKSLKENHPDPSTVTWPYFSVMDDMFGDKVRPTIRAIACSSGPEPPQTLKNIGSCVDAGNHVGTYTIKQKNRNVFIWPYKSVLLLLEQYKRVKHEFAAGEKRHGQIWDEIAESVQALNSSCKVTGAQCQQKLCGLKRTYAAVKENHSSFGGERVPWPFFSAMDNIFGNKDEEAEPSFLQFPAYSVLWKRKTFSSSPSSDDSQTLSAPAKKRKVRAHRVVGKDIEEDLRLMRLQRERKRQEREERRHEIEKMKMKQIRAMHEEKISMQRAALDILKEILLRE